MIKRKRRISLIVILLMLPLSVIFADSPFRVLSMSEDEIVIEWKMPHYTLEEVEIDGINYSRILGDFITYHRTEGYPLLPYFAENIGIPVDGSISPSVNNIESYIKNNIMIHPAEKVIVKNAISENNALDDYMYRDNLEISNEFYRNSRAYNSRSDYPERIIQQGVSAFAGDRHFTSFIFNPFIYNAHSRQLTVIDKAIINISIRGDKSRYRNFIPNRTYYDRAGEMLFINDDYSRYWRKPRSESSQYYQHTRSNGIDEIQLVVDKEGIYKVTYEDIASKVREWRREYNYDVDFEIDRIDPRYLELSSQYGVTPIHFVGERTGSFNPGDYFEFYGQRNFGKEGYSDTYTGENVYTLRMSDSWGARMAVESGGIRETNPRNYFLPSSYEHTIHFEEQIVHSSLSTYYKDSREDLWFWKTIRAPDLSVTTFNLEYPQETYIRGFSANVCLVGSTDIGSIQPDHRARVRVNSAFIGDKSWHGQSDVIFTNNDFNANLYLNHGQNYLYIDMPGDTPAGRMEAIFLDYFSITYWREYKTDSDYIKFSKPSDRPFGIYQFELENFSTEDVYIYKINSSIIENLQIEPFSETGAEPYTITFQDRITSDNVEYIALTSENKLSPKFIRPSFPSNLKNPANSADYIIVTVRDFIDIEGTQTIKNIWQNRGYSVIVVDIQSIFNEFNHGVRSAQAMKDFFAYAYNNWQQPMTDVLLLGKGIYDERDLSVHRDINHIPYKNIWTWKLGATPSDNWFACIVGNDIVPDFNIARITAWTKEQVAAVAEKSVRYLESPSFNDLWQPKITLVAGGQAGDVTDIFAQQNELIRNRWIPKDYNVVRVYAATQTVPSQYQGGTFRLRDSWETGTSFIQFMGHGGGRIWADYNLLNNNDIATLNNDNYPFVNSLSCYPSDFSRPGVGSIGENMVLTANRGAIAHYGFTGLGYLHEDLLVGYHLSEAIFHRNLSKFGDIISFTKAKSYTTIAAPFPRVALVDTAVLFGDPMLGFYKSQDRVPVNLNKYNITELDTLIISAELGTDIQFARFHIENDNEIIVNVPFDLPVLNGNFQAEYIVPSIAQSNYRRTVKVYGYGADRQVIGMTHFAVGRDIVTDIKTIPSKPTSVDSVFISARFFSEHGIKQVNCIVDGSTKSMVYNESSDLYILSSPITRRIPGSFVNYRFRITNELNQTSESPSYSYRVIGPDVVISHLELSSHENSPAVKVQVKNIGDYDSPTTSVIIYQRIGASNTFLNEKDIPSLKPLEEKWFYITIPPLQGSFSFRGHINPNNEFSEHNTINNTYTTTIQSLNMFYAGVSDTTVYSLDNNLRLDIPSNIFSEKQVFYINETPFVKPVNQPDIHQLSLLDGGMSKSYEIGVFNTNALRDSSADLPNNKSIRFTIKYNKNHPQTDYWANEGRFSFYRLQDEYNVWIHQGGFVDTEQGLVFREINRLGTYTILHNNDRTNPNIKANVQDQEFTYGGYISSSGVISFLLSDENGIDLFDRGIEFFLNGELISEDDYTVGVNLQNITSIPLKYQLDLTAGDYTLFIVCSDLNGNSMSHDINFTVSDKFDVINLANYPNPVLTETIDPFNSTRTRFTYVLTDDADDVKLRIYTVSGRLVKTFDSLPTGVGYHEYPRTVLAWDGRDESGVFLANGVYFYKLIATKGNKTVERVQKMAISR